MSDTEFLAPTIGHVLHHGQLRSHVALPPRFLKGQRGNTRSVPIGPEPRRALERYLAQSAKTLTVSHRTAFPQSLPRRRWRTETHHTLDGGKSEL